LNKFINARVEAEANYFLNTNKTIREVANNYNVSKSTVHKDLRERLPRHNPSLANSVEKIIDEHLNTRHIRGGEMTRLKYKGMKNEK
jgi:putative DeoR family transcriptional regulator, stage III sporulation protein D